MLNIYGSVFLVIEYLTQDTAASILLILMHICTCVLIATNNLNKKK